MVAYIECVVIPYMNGVHEMLGVGEDQAALVIFDHFKGKLTPKITELLEENITSVLVPPGCTNHLQPLDVSVKISAESFLRSEFQS